MPVMRDITATSVAKVKSGNTQCSSAEQLDPPMLECEQVLPLRKFNGLTTSNLDPKTPAPASLALGSKVCATPAWLTVCLLTSISK